MREDSFYPKSDHCNGHRFHNPDLKKPLSKKGFLDVLKWKMAGGMKKWPSSVKNRATPCLKQDVDENEAFITYVNHSTVLLQIEGLNILTDPVFSPRVSPFSWIGPKRVRPPGIALESLPAIDVVLISHNHYDHMDLASLSFIDKNHHPLFIMPLGNGSILKKAGITNVVELDWWEDYRLNDNHLFTLTPAQHWSRRSLFDYCKALWGGFLVTSKNLKIFFAGDSGYNSHFKEMRERYGNMDLSLLPIGAYEPRWFMQEFHMDPKEAVRAHLELGSRLSIGIHFGTFQLTDEAIDDPVLHLQESLLSYELSLESFIAPEHGQTVYFQQGPLLQVEKASLRN